MNDARKYIVRGQVFSAETVKGTKTLLYCMGTDRRNREGFINNPPNEGDPIFFVHAGKHKYKDMAKVTRHEYKDTLRAIESGDIEPIPREKVDWQRFTPASIGLTAVGHKMTGEEYIEKVCSGTLG